MTDPISSFKHINAVKWLPVLYAVEVSTTVLTSIGISSFEQTPIRIDRLPFVAPYLFQTGMFVAAMVGACSLGLLFSYIRQEGVSALASLVLGLASMICLYIFAVVPSENLTPSSLAYLQTSVFLYLHLCLMLAHGLVTVHCLNSKLNRQPIKPISRVLSLRATLLGSLAVMLLIFTLSYLVVSHTSLIVQASSGFLCLLVSAGYFAFYYRELGDVKISWMVETDFESKSLLQTTF